LPRGQSRIATGPEGLLIVAQRFIAGYNAQHFQVPEGRLNMSHSYVSNRMHCVFSTKERRRLIDPDLEARLWPSGPGLQATELSAIAINYFVQAPRLSTEKRYTRLRLGPQYFEVLNPPIQRSPVASSSWPPRRRHGRWRGKGHPDHSCAPGATALRGRNARDSCPQPPR